MKKTTVTVTFEEEKLTALKMYLEKNETNVEQELTKALENLYAKTVPAEVRRFFEMKSGAEPAPVVTRQKKPRNSAPMNEANDTAGSP